MHRNLERDEEPRAEHLQEVAPVLAIEGLRAGYDGEVVLEDVSLEVPMGQWIVLLGPNGSGKSTLLYCIAGLLAPLAGSIRLSGHSLARCPSVAKRSLGFACAPERLPALLTGRQCLEVYAAAKRCRAIDPDVLLLAESLDLMARLDQYIDTYSLGARQKLATLLALVGAPRLIVLDETFNGLDPASARTVKQHLLALVRRGSASVLLATHALDVVERYADRAALLLEGRLARDWGLDELARLKQSPVGLEDAVAAETRRCHEPRLRRDAPVSRRTGRP